MNSEDITFIVPTSVLVTHPDTSIIDKVIKSIRNHFPQNEIILQVDGLRREQKHRKEQYDEYKNKILWKCLHEYKNVLPIIFDEFSHQSNMMKETIDLINTPLMFYIEGDIELKENIDLDWQEIINLLASEKAFTVRFYTYNNAIEEAHMHMMLGQEGNFMKTFQWSQQPHISYVSYYKGVVLPNTTPKLFIEDKFHGKVATECHENPEKWDMHRLWLYNPPGKDIRIANDLDGRKNLRKFTSDDKAWGLTEK